MPSLENNTFTVAILNTTFFRVTRLDNGTVIGYAGRDYLILQTLSLLLGFRYRLVIPGDNQYGVLDLNGSWNGLLGMLARGEADFSAMTIALSVDRRKAFNFSFICKRDSFVYVTKKMASHSTKSSYFFVKPFNKRLWFILVLIFLPFCLLLPTVRLCLPKYNRLVRTFTLWNILSLVMGLSNLRSFILTDFNGLTVAALVVTLGSTLKIYSSMLASSVNTNSYDLPINSIEDLADAVQNRNYSVGILKGHDIIQVILKNSLKAEMQILAKHLEDKGKPGQKTINEAYESVVSSNYALIVSFQTFIKQMTDRRLDMRQVYISAMTLLTNNKAMPYGSSFVYKSRFNGVLRRILTYGLLPKWEAHEQFKMDKEVSLTAIEPKVKYIDNSDLEYIFISIICAHWFSFLVLLVEKLFFTIFYTTSRNATQSAKSGTISTIEQAVAKLFPQDSDNKVKNS